MNDECWEKRHGEREAMNKIEQVKAVYRTYYGVEIRDDCAEEICQLFEPDEWRLLTMIEMSAAIIERRRSLVKNGYKPNTHDDRYAVAKAQRDLTARKWREKHYNDCAAAKKSGWDDAEKWFTREWREVDDAKAQIFFEQQRKIKAECQKRVERILGEIEETWRAYDIDNLHALKEREGVGE